VAKSTVITGKSLMLIKASAVMLKSLEMTVFADAKISGI
jgi:hypothetical protein